jgi:hypothetical protein
MKRPPTLNNNKKLNGATHLIGTTLKTLRQLGFNDKEIIYLFSCAKEMLRVIKVD